MSVEVGDLDIGSITHSVSCHSGTLITASAQCTWCGDWQSPEEGRPPQLLARSPGTRAGLDSW